MGFCPLPHMRENIQKLRMFNSLFFVSSEPVGQIFAFNTSYDAVQRNEMHLWGGKIDCKI